MAENWGDLLAIDVSRRIGPFVDTPADLEDLNAQYGDDGRLFVAMSDRSLWVYDKDSTDGASDYVKVPADGRSSGRFAKVDAALAASVAGLVSDVPGLTCLSGDAVGDAVYISGASTVAKADADAPLIPAIGIIVSKETTTSCTVRVSGLVTGLSGLTAGSIYYLSATAGAITATAPAMPNAVPVGVAISTTSLLVLPAGPAFAALRNLRMTGSIPLPPSSWYLLTGAPLAVFEDGTTTVPGSDFDSSKCFCIRWNNDAAPAAITRSFQIPPDMDITVNPVLHIRVAKVGATNDAGNTTTMAIGLFNQVDSALITADSDFGGASSALTPNATSLTIQNLTRTITASDLAAHPASVTITMKPTAGTLNTDDLLFVDAYVAYSKKPLSA